MGQKVPRAPKRESRQVDAAASSVPIGGTNKGHPSFRFAGADPNKFCLHEWGTTEIERFVRSLAKIERFTWQQIIASGGQGYSSGGPGYKPIPSYELPTLPQQVPLDVVVPEMRVDKTKRILGYRDGAIFHLIWFDRTHAAVGA